MDVNINKNKNGQACLWFLFSPIPTDKKRNKSKGDPTNNQHKKSPPN